MKKLSIAALLLPLLISTSHADASQKKQCQSYYKERIKSINKQLKAGYREPRGNYLRQKRREYKEQIKKC